MRTSTVIWVTDAQVLAEYRLRVCFSDGSEGEVDLKEFIEVDSRPVVKALRDLSMFSAIRVEMDTVVWENGFDLAPEFLRAMAKPRVPA